MINFSNLNKSEPYLLFQNYYDQALEAGEDVIEAILIASLDKDRQEVDARFVNLKYIINDEWIFFTNYNSPKSHQFRSHKKICAILYWKTINVQIRINAEICETKADFSDKHFAGRAIEKNALAISSKQSQSIESYDAIISNYENQLAIMDASYKRPIYWGGYSFTPFSMEFWTGHQSRINNRIKYIKENSLWNKTVLQP